MTLCLWEEIKAFQNYSEFNRFTTWMTEQVSLKIAQELKVSEHYIGATTFQEKWFKHNPSGQVWRLVWPDAPFKGVFERVK